MSDSSTSKTAKVIFLPSGRRGEVPLGQTLLDAARQLGEPIESICGGHGACGKCQVVIQAGSFPKLGISSSLDHVTPPTPQEATWLQGHQVEEGALRLACHARVLGDVVAFVPEYARTHQQVIRKDATDRVIEVKPAIRQVYVELTPPSLADRRSDWERLRDGLASQWGLAHLDIAYPALLALPQALREGAWKVTVVLWQDARVLAVRPGYQEGIWGLAVDIGSTTMVAHLCDLQTGERLATQAAMNPQVRYGEDLMSRISFAAQPDGLVKLHRAIIGAFNRLAAQTAAAAGLTSTDIHEAVVVGNPTMMSLFLNLDPKSLGEEPFVMAHREAMDLPARELKLRLHPAAQLHLLPAVAGHVGADHVAALLAEALHEREQVTLLVDVGTNAEIALWNGERIFNASSPTGPAFEGAQIRHGMRAAPGAIERVRIDPETLAVRFKVIGEERWSDAWSPEAPPAVLPTGICGSGIIEAVAEGFLAGLILPDGRFHPDLEHPRLVWEGKKGAFVLATAEETGTGTPILITQDDVRAIQLAKAALYAGSRLLMAEAGVDRVERIILAGAFGSYIDPFHALVLGMIPDAPLEQIRAVGNAAGDGALMALLNREQRALAQTLAQSCHYVETATHPGFQDAFVAAIPIPHAHDAFPHIADRLPAQVSLRPRERRRVRGRRKA